MDAFLSLVTLNGSIEPWGLLIVCVLLTLAGFVDAIGGGGGLISIPAFLFAGLPVHTAVATNKMSSCMGTTLATIKYIRNGFMLWWLALPCVACGFLGSTTGAHVSLIASETVIRIAMLVVIPIAGFYVIRKKSLETDKEPWSKRRTLALCMLIAFCIGLYDGFYGPGTGTFLMLLLTGIGRLKVTHAAGVTKAINLTTNVSALVVFLLNGAVCIPIGLIGGTFNIIGNYFGANLFTEKGSAIVRPIILVVLAVFAIRVICELAGIV